jgi:fibulin 1/2
LCVMIYPTDINECAENSDNCDQLCHNNIGSFSCTCNPGSTLDGNGHTCHGKWSACRNDMVG